MKIPYQKLYQDAHAPTHNHKGDAGLDFYSIELKYVEPFDYAVVKTGIRVQIPEGYVGLLFPRGKNDHLLGAGVIDTYYDGEVLFKVVNYTDSVMEITRGYPIGQMIFVPFAEPLPLEAFNLDTIGSGRGDSGGIMKDLEINITP